MTFYIKPPEGNIALKRLHQDAEIRLKFLHLMHQHPDDNNLVTKIMGNEPAIAAHSDCLIDGSMRDRTSHFILRLASLKSKAFQTFLVEAETRLFKLRIDGGDQSTLKQNIVNLKRHTQYALKHQHLAIHHHELLLQSKEMVQLILSSGMTCCMRRNICSHSISVPWTMAHVLVKERKVAINRGMAKIPCCLLTVFLSLVFQDIIIFGISELLSDYKRDSVLFDQRMGAMNRSLQKTFSKFGGQSIELNMPFSLNHRDIEKEHKFFPLCMRQLHRVLSENNRLRHHARFRYTLFLKDIGLTLQENIAFWEQFYSRPFRGSTTGCCHSWTGSSESRYIYSIRHVYGLEGKRINYTSHSCSALQALTSQPMEMSGCPFTGQDSEALLSLIEKFYSDQPSLENIKKQIIEGEARIACKLLLKYLLPREDILPCKCECRNEYSSKNVHTELSSVKSEPISECRASNHNHFGSGSCQNDASQRLKFLKYEVQNNESNYGLKCRLPHVEDNHLERMDKNKIVSVHISNTDTREPNVAIDKEMSHFCNSLEETRGINLSSVQDTEGICGTSARTRGITVTSKSERESISTCASQKDTISSITSVKPAGTRLSSLQDRYFSENSKCHCLKNGLCNLQSASSSTKGSCTSLHDIEDAPFSSYNFHRPSEYYLILKSNFKTAV